MGGDKEEKQEDRERDRRAENRGGKGEEKDVRERENRDERSEIPIRGESGIRIGLWNVAGLGNKDRDFWKKLEDWRVIVLIET